MATYYWVGGSGTWDATTTTHWASSSGGSGGVAAPTSSDNVIFDANSGTGPTVTIGTTATCANMTASAPVSGTLIFAFSTTGILSFTGNWVSPASGFGTSGTGSVATGGIVYTGSGSSTFTTNGLSISTYIGVNGTGSLVLGGALTTTGGIVLSQGTFDTGASGYALSCASVAVATTSPKTLKLNGSTVTVTATSGFQLSSPITLNAGTSQLNLTGSATPTLSIVGNSLYNVSFISSSTSAKPIISSAGTYNNLSFSALAGTAGISTITVTGNQIINGTLSIPAGLNATYRRFVLSSTIGSTVTITAAAVSLTDADFRDITGAGAATWSGTRLGDCKGNSGITFASAKTVYWNLAAGGNWSATAWATSVGGTPAVSNFPLAQDTAIFPSTGLNTSATVTIDAAWNIGTIDMSARLFGGTQMILATNAAPIVYGNWVGGQGASYSGANQITFSGRGSQTITSVANAFTQSININSPGGSVALQDNFSTSSSSSGAATLTNGTLNLNGNTLSITNGTFLTGSGTKNLTFNGGTLSISSAGTTAFNNSQSSGFTTTAGTGTGTISMTSASAKTFASGGSVFNCVLNQAGTGTLSITSCTLLDITNTAVGATTISLISGPINLTNFSATGASGAVLTLTVSSLAQVAITNRPSTLNYISATNIFASSAPMYLGTGSTVTNCVNVYASAYVAPFTHYWVGGSGTWDTTTTTHWSSSSGGSGGSTPPAGDENVIFDQASGYTTTLTGNITCNNLTVSAGTVAFAPGTSPSVYVSGSFSLVSGTTWANISLIPINFLGSSTGKTITTNGTTITGSVSFIGSGSWSLGSALTVGGTASTVVLASGSFNANGYNVTLSGSSSSFAVGSSAAGTSLSIGSGTWTLAGSGTVWIANGFTGPITGTGTISLISASAKTFAGNGIQTYPTLNQGGAGALTITGSNGFANITNTYSATGATSILFTAGTTNTFSSWSAGGSSGKLLTIGSATAATHTLSKSSGTVSVDYLSISYSVAAGGATWYAGANSTNGGNNSGWIFSGPPSGNNSNFLIFF